MPICFKDQNVCFFPIPKTASTSIKAMLFPEEQNPQIMHDKYQTVGFSKLTKADHDSLETYQKIALIRDPIERVISCYRQRILASDQLGRLFRKNGNPYNLSEKPTFDEYIQRFNLYNSTCDMLDHHVQSTIYYLGKDLNYFTKVYKMSEIKLLENYLQQTLNTSHIIRKVNSTSINPFLSNKLYLKWEIFNELKAIFKEDYEVYNFDEFNKDNYLNLQMI